MSEPQRYAIAALGGALLALWMGRGPILESRWRERKRLEESREQLLVDRIWIRDLAARARESEATVKELVPLDERIRRHFPGEEGERIRLTMARDEALKGLATLTLSPIGTATPPGRVPVETQTSLQDELAILKKRYLKSFPREAFAAWDLPSTVDILRVEDSLKLEGTLPELATFLDRLDRDPLFLEIADLEIEGFRSEQGNRENVSATITMATAILPELEQMASEQAGPASGELQPPGF